MNGWILRHINCVSIKLYIFKRQSSDSDSLGRRVETGRQHDGEGLGADAALVLDPVMNVH